MKHFRALNIVATLFLMLSIVGLAYAATHAPTNRTSVYTGTNAPLYLNPGWRFWAATDTVWGEVVCIEVHPVGDSGNYVKVEGVYNSTFYAHDGHTDYEYKIDVFTSGVPAAFQNKSVEYQFFTDWDDNNCSAGANFSGFNWTFNSGPTTVTLTRMQARPAAWPFALGALLLVGAALVLRKQ